MLGTGAGIIFFKGELTLYDNSVDTVSGEVGLSLLLDGRANAEDVFNEPKLAFEDWTQLS